MKNIIKLSTNLLIILLLFATSFTTVVSANSININSAEHQSSQIIDIDQEMKLTLKEGKFPSISVGIVVNESLVWHGGYGKYNKLLRLKPTKNTVYMAGSISKAIAATALMQLIENESYDLDLDDDVSDYLPFVLRNPNYPDVPITFRLLLSHQSSLSMSPWKELMTFGAVYIFLPKYFPYPALKWHLVPGAWLYRPGIWTDNRPGEAFNYSNTGFLINQYLIEQISGMSFNKYCKKYIFNPLNMTNSSFHKRDIRRLQRAVPYLLRGNFHIRLPFYDVPDSAAGGLLTSVEDLSHFLIAHMTNGTYNGVRILKNESIELMHTNYNIYYNPDNLASIRYGFGWMFYNISGLNLQGHDGDTPGFSARMAFDEKNNTGIIITFNRSRRQRTPEELNEDLALSDEITKLLFEKSKEYR